MASLTLTLTLTLTPYSSTTVVTFFTVTERLVARAMHAQKIPPRALLVVCLFLRLVMPLLVVRLYTVP